MGYLVLPPANGRRFVGQQLALAAYIGAHLLDVISTFETDLRYLRVAMGASASPGMSALVRSFHIAPSVNVSARLKLHL
jgi:hypothetical protein